MHYLIAKIRHLKQVGAFQISNRLLLMFLLSLGLYVATMPLTAPDAPKVNDKLIHLIVFFGFSILMDLAVSRKPSWLWKGLPLVAYGLFVEILQKMTEYRSFEWLDIVADMSGVLLYFGMKWLIKRSYD